MNKEHTSVAYLESRGDVDEYLREAGESQNGVLCIAMNPSARAYAEEKKIRGLSTLPFLTRESHARLSLKSKEICDWISRNVNLFDKELDIKEAYERVLNTWLKYVINYCLITIEIAANSYQTYKPEEIMASSTPKRRMRLLKDYLTPMKALFIQRLLVQPDEKFLGSILRNFAESKKLAFRDIAGRKGLPAKIHFLPQGAIRLFAVILMKCLCFSYRIARVIKIAWKTLRSQRIVFLTTKTAYMRNIAATLKTQNKVSLYFLEESLIPVFDDLGSMKFSGRLKALVSQKTNLERLSGKINEAKALFSYRNISFEKAVTRKLCGDIGPYVIGLAVWARELSGMIRKIKPSLVLSSGNRDDDLITAELCKAMDIPAAFISHGSFTDIKDEIEHIEWGEHGKKFLRAPFSHQVLQTPLAEKYLETFPSEAGVIKTGPLIWGRAIDRNKSESLSRKIFGKRQDLDSLKVILHASSPKRNKGFRFHVYETPDEYVQALIDLAGAVEKVPNAALVIKLRPSEEFTRESIKRLVPFSEKIILSTEESFSDLLGMAELLVSFSSTTIEEALQNKIPVLLYGGGGRYQHIAGYQIKEGSRIIPSAIYYAKTKAVLPHALKSILGVKTDKASHMELFEPYIYSKGDRVPLTELLKK